MMVETRRHPLLDPQVLLRGMVLIATLVGIGLLLQLLGLKSMLQTGWVDQAVRGHGLMGAATLVVVGSAFTALGLPRQVPAFLAGYAFGFVDGTVIGLLATLGGGVATFQYARFMGRDFLVRRFPHRIKRIDDFLSGNTVAMALVLRLSPFSSNLAANLAAGVSGVRPLPFFAGSAAGYLPQTLVFALLGSGFALDPALRMSLSVALFVVSSVLGIWLWRRFRGARGLPEDLAEVEAE
jgi:uncharacterized membrane protein YdjX (TVP38/TMEM64 family)